MMCKRLLVSFLLLFVFCCAVAQTACPPFWNEILAFKKSDSAKQAPKNAILFVGSSSFTNWKDVADYFPGHTIINRGFGGSGLTDVIRYAYDIILPYRPKQVVIYCGENDLASNGSLEPLEVVRRFQTLFGIIRQNLPQANILFVSMKPSPSRKALFPKFVAANNGIRVFLKGQPRAAFVDVWKAMLTPAGDPLPGIFLADNLHMNAGGYRIWQHLIQPYLLKK